MLGIESESFGNLLVPIIMEKIPSELRLVVSCTFGSDGMASNRLLLKWHFVWDFRSKVS